MKGECEYMFLGTNHFTIDSKGRVSVPAKWRKLNEDDEFVGFITPPGLTNSEKVCMHVYTQNGFSNFMNKLQSAKYSTSKAAMTQILDTTQYLKVDSQGRILLSDDVRNAINVKDTNNIVLYGSMDKFEIWNEDDIVYDHNAAAQIVDVADVLDQQFGGEN